ncbi:MAG TPA: hypothetical protein GX716_10895 [Firmicutes bacterium]|nr:hypothetical protein [Candidatus Fermentithermobacillaceae bacterium]
MPYPVTPDFNQKMQALERRVLAKAVIDYTDPFLDQSIEAVVSEEANVSYPVQVADSIAEPFAKIASLDGSCTLDGTYALAPDPDEAATHQMGWWGSQLAGAGGAFSAPYPTLTVTHERRPVHTLRVTGDSKREEWPVDFTIDLYAADDTLLRTESVTGNTQVAWSMTLPTPVLDVAKQVLTITRWSHEGRQVKILEFFTSIQETYLADDLMSFNLLEESEVSQASIPIGNISANEVSLALSNKTRKFDIDNDQSPLKNLLKVNRKVRLWIGVDIDGTVEWVPLGVFWTLDDWDSPDDELQATVTARDRLELLRKGTYQSSHVLTNVSLGALAEIVLQDAGLVPSEYHIDAALYSVIVPYAWFQPVSHREALRLIAEAGLAVVYCDREGIVRMEAFDSGGLEVAMDFATGRDYFRTRTPVRPSQVINEVIVTTQPLRPAAVPEEVYRSNEPLSVGAGQTVVVTVHYNQPPVIEAAASLESPPAGVSIVGATYYGWGAEVSIYNANGSAQQVTLVINGKPLSVMNKERAVARDEQSIIENAVLRYEFPANPLVQTPAQAQPIADTLLASAKDPRRDIEIDWRGSPALLLGDRIRVKGADYHVTANEIEWAGSLRETTTARRVI